MDCACREAPGVPMWVLCNLATDLALSYHSSWCLLKHGQVAEVHGRSTCGHACTAVHLCKAKGTRAWPITAASVRALHGCAHLPGPAASLTTTRGRGKGRRDLLGSGNVQPVILSTPYSSIHTQNKLSITQCCKKETSPSQKPATIFMFKKPKL